MSETDGPSVAPEADAGEQRTAFEAQAGLRRRGLWAEMGGLLRHNRKWWLAPVLLLILLLGGLVFVLATPAGPLIYTLF